MTITLTREEAQQVLDAFLGIGQRAYDAVSGDAFHECSIAVSRLRARLSAPEPEPVALAWAEGYKAGIEDERSSEANIGIAGFGAKVEPARQNPYTAPPQREEGCAECGKKSSDGWALYCVKCSEREWQGLTDEEAEQIVDDYWHDVDMFIEAIEAKLKEKNASHL